MPDGSSNPGFDLVVDGHEVQVKCAEDLSTIAEHFAAYPDTPVIANAELVDKITDQPWADLVTTLEGYELAAVDALSKRAVEAGANLASSDALSEAIVVGWMRGAIGLVRGQIPADHLPAWVVVDTALRGTLVLTGGKLGAVIGLVVVGPAGAIVLGPAMGVLAVFGVAGARDTVDRVINRDWHDALRRDAAALHLAVEKALRKRVDLLVRRRQRMREAAAGRPDDLADWLDRRAADDAISTAEDLIDLGSGPETLIEALLIDLIATRSAPVSPAVLQARGALRRRLSDRPAPLDGVFASLAKVRARSRRLASGVDD